MPCHILTTYEYAMNALPRWNSPHRILSDPDNFARILSEMTGIPIAGFRWSDPIGYLVIPIISDSRIRLSESCNRDSDDFRHDRVEF